MRRPTIRVVRDEADVAFREATCTIEKIRESPQRPTASGKNPSDNDQDCHLVDPDSSVELDCMPSTDFSVGSQQQAGKALRTKKSGIGKPDSPAFTAAHLQGPTTTTVKALGRSTNASNQPFDLRYRYTANQPGSTAFQASQTPQTLEPDLNRLKRAVGLSDHDYSYPQQLWRQRSTRPLTPTRSQALAYMSLSDAKPWPMEVPRLEKEVDGEPEPLVRIRAIEARRATMFSVTDSMAVEVDSSTDSSDDEEENEKPKKGKKKHQANKLRKLPRAAASLCCIGAGDSCFAKKFWRWARGLPTSPSSPENACSSCRRSTSTQLTHEEIARKIKREVWDWTPESGSLSPSASPSSSSDEELVKVHKEVDEWIPAAKQRPANTHPDHPRWRYLAPRRVRVSSRKLSGRFTPPERVRVVCMPCIEECREEEEEEEQVEFEGSEGFDGGDDGEHERAEVGIVKTERVDGVLDDEKPSDDRSSSSEDDDSVNSDLDLDDAVLEQARAVPIKKVQLSDSSLKEELERLRRAEWEREKRDSLEPTLSSGSPPPVPPHREGSLREFQQKRF